VEIFSQHFPQLISAGIDRHLMLNRIKF